MDRPRIEQFGGTLKQGMPMLPVALDGDPKGLLIDDMGRPVWPASKQTEIDLLASTANRVGLMLYKVRASNASTELPNHGSGVVASVEPSLSTEARLYAHLTNRQFVAPREARQLAEIENLEVVVCSSDAISSLFLHYVYDPARGTSPGIVYGRTQDELRAQVLRASALAQLAPRSAGTYVQIWPDRGAGSNEERSWVASAVQLDASVLAVLTHSDGLDAPLVKGVGRGNLLICPVRNALDVPPHRTPECRHSGWCHRVRMPIEDAFASGDLIAPQQFRARVLVWSACFGVLDSGAPLDRQWSVVHQFNANPGIDAVLTKWQGSFGHGPFTEMMQRLSDGASVGEVVAGFNATSGVHEQGTQFAILGDPRLTAPFRDVDPGLQTYYLSLPSVPERRRNPPPAPAMEEECRTQDPALMLRDCIKVQLRHDDEEQAADTARMLFDEAHQKIKKDAGNLHGICDLQNATLECFRRYPDVIRGWSPHVVAQRFSVGTRCAHCGELMTQAINELAMPWSSRRIATCPRCQIVEDSPVEFDLDFRVTEERQLELVGTIPAGRFAGIIVIWSTTPIMGTVCSWPVTSDGRPLRRTTLNVEWPRATARATVWMMFDLNFLTLNHRLPGAN